MPISVVNTARFNRPMFNRAVTHGDQLTIYDVGPWALQQQYPGDELLAASPALPVRGYYRFDEPAEFLSDTPWPANANDSNPDVLNDPDLHAGVVTGAPVTIDGYSIPVGTYILQFYEWPDNSEFYAQTTALKILFRGCRWRHSLGLSGAGLFNDANAQAAQQIMTHYCDVGMQSADPANGASGMMHIKNLAGTNHRYLRGYHSLTSTFFQPNTQGCQFIENYCTDMVYSYGEAGPNGTFDSAAYHNNGISSEGGLQRISILRNRLVFPSPDPAIGSTGTAAGQIGYGTQPGQTGYGAGSNPGRGLYQTDCIALFAITGPNQGASPGDILIDGNLLGGTGYCLYAGNADGNAQGIHLTNNRFTTRHWTNGANFGPIADVPAWGSNGNFEANNTWADDFGSGGDGFTLLADRGKPWGNGPRRGRSIFAGGQIAAYAGQAAATAAAQDAMASNAGPLYILPGTVGFLGNEASLTVENQGSLNQVGPGTYDGYLFDGGLYIGPGAGAYVFRNCVIQGKAASWLIFAFEGGTSFLFEDCTFRWKAGDALSDNGAGVIQSLVSPPATIPGAIIRRCDISGKADGIQLAATSTIEDCYIHDLVWAGTPPDNTHNDGVQFYEGDLTLTGCYFDVGAQAPYSNSCCFFQSATIGNVLAEGNYFNGGGYSYYVQNGTHTVRNNTFGPEHLFGTHAFEGAGWALAEWSGNVDHLGSPVSF